MRLGICVSGIRLRRELWVAGRNLRHEVYIYCEALRQRGGSYAAVVSKHRAKTCNRGFGRAYRGSVVLYGAERGQIVALRGYDAPTATADAPKQQLQNRS